MAWNWDLETQEDSVQAGTMTQVLPLSRGRPGTQPLLNSVLAICKMGRKEHQDRDRAHRVQMGKAAPFLLSLLSAPILFGNPLGWKDPSRSLELTQLH